jgi:hypothetical protein
VWSRPAAIAVTTSALLVAACGGAGAVTHRDDVVRADAICAAALRRVGAVPAPAGSGPSALAPYLDRVLPILRAQDVALHRLHRPAQGHALGARRVVWLQAEGAAVAAYASLDHAAHRGDAGALASAEAALRDSPVAALAARYGLSDCAHARSTAA